MSGENRFWTSSSDASGRIVVSMINREVRHDFAVYRAPFPELAMDAIWHGAILDFAFLGTTFKARLVWDSGCQFLTGTQRN